MKTGLNILVMSMVLLSALLVIAPPGYAGDKVLVPLRWCACQGSPAVENPGGAGEPDTDNVLWRRHERSSDRFWIRKAGVTFRSAITAEVRDMRSFPIIPDPRPPAEKFDECGDPNDTSPTSGPGECGDILDPNLGDSSEYDELLADCEAAWNALAERHDTTLTGPIAVNIYRFVDSDGNPTSLGGWGGNTLAGRTDDGDEMCFDPEAITRTHSGGLAIVDNQKLIPPANTRSLLEVDPDETLLSHELGHVLRLKHGNGEDDDSNGELEVAFGYDRDDNNRIDSDEYVCDPEDSFQLADPEGVMTSGGEFPHPAVLGTRHMVYARKVAEEYIGAQIDPPQVVIPGDVVGDFRVDAVRDVLAEDIDIVLVGIAENEAEGRTTIFHRLIGVIPGSATNSYLTFLDLDGNSLTGGLRRISVLKRDFRGRNL